MQFPWRKTDAATSEPLKPVTERTAVEWSNEITQLQSELSRIDVERAALTGSAGNALLDGQGALVSDIQGKLAEFSTTAAIIQAAIAAAEGHRASARRREDREATDALESEYYTLLATHCAARVGLREAEQRLAEATAAARNAVDGVRLDTLYQALLKAGRVPEAAEDPERRRSADQYRFDAARYRERAGVAAAEAVAVEVAR
jgi:hypothetical protein